ncbi:MAG: SGNH/GDSL hydrolase family protein [Bacteroidota bacterium]
MLKRRSFLRNTTLGLAATPLITLPNISAELPKNLTVLFQGDSITDAGRSRGNYYANAGSGMGIGYVQHAATHLMGNQPKVDWKIYNRGISGHKVFQLANRWEEDALQLQPDLLSILIGVNDFWHTLSHNYEGTVENYEQDLTKLLERTKKSLPNVKLLIGEPFVCDDGTAIATEKWRLGFPAYQAVSKNIAKQFDAIFIPYQKVFDEARKVAPTSYWCPDGVHPSMAGNYLMAKAWLEGFEQLF